MDRAAATARTVLVPGPGGGTNAATGTLSPTAPPAATSPSVPAASTATALPDSGAATQSRRGLDAGDGQPAPLRPWVLGSVVAAGLTGGAHRWLVAARRRRLADAAR